VELDVSILVFLRLFLVRLPVVCHIFFASYSYYLAALFFCSYECLKRVIGPDRQNIFTLACSSSISEVVACTVRVPVEVIKQRMQVGIYKKMNFVSVLLKLVQSEGPSGLYRGFTATIQREIPFAALQFPIYEALKQKFAHDDRSKMALCGSVAGGITAFLTTPLDVLKTRTMLNLNVEEPSFRNIWKEGKVKSLFSGAVPRVIWVSVGGFVFFGVYEKIMHFSRSSRQSANGAGNDHNKD
jgi:solute carrier family 25 (mitochondrial S-adenosylmethionine transporter), member 26